MRLQETIEAPHGLPYIARALIEECDSVLGISRENAVHLLHGYAVVAQAHIFDHTRCLIKGIVAIPACALHDVDQPGLFVVFQEVRRDTEILGKIADSIVCECFFVVGHCDPPCLTVTTG